VAPVARTAHLIARFVETVPARPPDAEDEVWAAEQLEPAEWAVWSRLADTDRRHLVQVAREVENTPAALEHRWLIRAALLHDIGKGEAEIGVVGRVAATLIDPLLPSSSWLRSRLKGRIGRYLRYPDSGARLLTELGSPPPVVAWAREHHLGPAHWTIAHDAGVALAHADG